MSRRPVFKSVFASLMNSYLDMKTAAGVACLDADHANLFRLDSFILARGIGTVSFGREDADMWRSRRKDESDTCWYKRVNVTKHFMEYLVVSGYDVCSFRDVAPPKSNFSPHIYSEDETVRYFSALDSYDRSTDPLLLVKIPVLFRILQSCGTRITETLHIRKRDVDLSAGVIRLTDTKGKKQRYIVLSDSMLSLMRKLAEKTFYLLSDSDYVFSNAQGVPYAADTIRDIHSRLLRMAGIQNRGDGRGPRLHDWRHTMAVNSFRQLISAGVDTYAALPLLATYLGHETLEATERYVRLAACMYPDLEAKMGDAVDRLFGTQE